MAKWYYAKMYVDTGDYVACPGEVIEGDFSKEDVERWLKLGAISECSAPVGVPDDAEPETCVDAEPETGADADTEEAASDEETTEAEDAEEDADTAETEEDEAEPEPPAVIDVMDGITAAPAPKEENPKTTRRTRGGKTK